MPKFVQDVEQGSPEWRELRLGIPTASSFDRIITEVKGEMAAGRWKYAYELACERLLHEDTSLPLDGLHWVERGKLLETDAVKHYEAIAGTTTDRIGLIMTDDGKMACSPDRIQTDKLVGLEIKCPMASTHAQYMREGPGKAYRWQVLGCLLISQFERWDFVSYHPNLREVIIPYERTTEAELEIKKLDAALTQFKDEVDGIEAYLRKEGFVDPMVALPKRAEDEWRKMLEADPSMWAIA
jgi:hypothetical protein